MIKPSIGRKVWYWPGLATVHASVSDQPHDATICAVWSDTCVNLAIRDANGAAYAMTSVLLLQEGAARPAHQFAEWMPYQISQAKKDTPDDIVTGVLLEDSRLDKILSEMQGLRSDLAIAMRAA